MRVVEIYGFQPSGDHSLDPLSINITKPLPDVVRANGFESIDEFLAASHDRFDEQARQLFEALRDSLPGGTIDRLTGYLLQYKASHLIVNHKADVLREIAIHESIQDNAHLTDAQRRLVDLDLRKAEISAYYDELDATLEAIAAESGVNSYFKADDGIVYKLTIPEGRFVQFKPFDYARTKREGERAGSLSMKEAATVFPADDASKQQPV